MQSVDAAKILRVKLIQLIKFDFNILKQILQS